MRGNTHKEDLGGFQEEYHHRGSQRGQRRGEGSVKTMLSGTWEGLDSSSPRSSKGVKFRLGHGGWRSVSGEGSLDRHQCPARESALDPKLNGEPLWDFKQPSDVRAACEKIPGSSVVANERGRLGTGEGGVVPAAVITVWWWL